MRWALLLGHRRVEIRDWGILNETQGEQFFFCWFDVHKNGTRGWEVPGCNLLDIIEIVEIQLEPHAISCRFPQPPLQGKAGE